MAKQKTLIELLSQDITFSLRWSPQTVYVDRFGAIRVGNRKHPLPSNSKYIKHARDRGVVFGMPNADYHAERDHISSSGLKMFDENPRRYHANYIAKSDRPGVEDMSDDKKVGSLTHSLLLDDDDTFQASFAVEPTEIPVDGGAAIPINKRKDDHREWLKAWTAQEAAAGKTIVTDELLDAAFSLAGCVEQCEMSKELLSHPEALKEVSLFAPDVNSGARLKVRLDLFTRYKHEPCIVDIKTTTQPSPQHFVARDVDRFGYDVSLAFYRKVVRSLTGVTPKSFWLALSKDKEGHNQPYLVGLDDDDWMDAEAVVDEMLKRLERASMGDQFVSPFVGGVTTCKLRRRLRAAEPK